MNTSSAASKSTAEFNSFEKSLIELGLPGEVSKVYYREAVKLRNYKNMNKKILKIAYVYIHKNGVRDLKSLLDTYDVENMVQLINIFFSAEKGNLKNENIEKSLLADVIRYILYIFNEKSSFSAEYISRHESEVFPDDASDF